MFDVYLAEVLILLLILITTLRIFFTKKVRIDSTAVFAPVSFFFALLLFYVWGADAPILLVCVLSFFTFFINIRSLLRLSARLYVDHYNVRFVIPTIIIALGAFALLVVVTIFHPVRYKVKDFGVTKTKTALTGNDTTGYKPWEMLSDRPNVTGVLYEYAPKELVPVPQTVLSEQDTASASETRPVILFVPKCSAATIYYEPYFLLLAQRGYRVLAADFNGERRIFGNAVLDSRFFRRFYTLYLRAAQEEQFKKALADDTANVLRGYEALARLALATYGADTTLFFAVENVSSDAVQAVASQFAKNALGSFWLNRIEEYKTTDFGFVEQTDPLTAHFLGAERESMFFIPRYVAGKTIDAIVQAQKLAAPAEIIKSADDAQGEEQ